jgi:hypothetical protein
MGVNDLKLIEEAWLGLDQAGSNFFNPMQFVAADEDEFNIRLAWLMTQPDYLPFIARNILNTQLLPSQSLILRELWERKFPMLIATRGAGKSFMLSLYSILRALILPKRKIVIVGAAFRQSKILFEYMETLWNNSPMLRDICDGDSGPRRDTDRCTLKLNDSTIFLSKQLK